MYRIVHGEEEKERRWLIWRLEDIIIKKVFKEWSLELGSVTEIVP